MIIWNNSEILCSFTYVVCLYISGIWTKLKDGHPHRQIHMVPDNVPHLLKSVELLSTFAVHSVNRINSSHLHLYIVCICNSVVAKTEITWDNWNSWLQCGHLFKLLVDVNMNKFTHWGLHLNTMHTCLTSTDIPVAFVDNLQMDQ